MHQEEVTCRQPRDGHRGRDRGRDLHQPCGGDPVDAVGRFDHLTRLDGDVLGVASPGEQGDAGVAHLPADHLLAHFGYLARAFQPENLAGPGRRRVVTLPLQQVGPVDPGGYHLDQHLPGAGLRRLHLAHLQNVRATRFGGDHGEHPHRLSQPPRALGIGSPKPGAVRFAGEVA